jgi:hypothetical protein
MICALNKDTDELMCFSRGGRQKPYFCIAEAEITEMFRAGINVHPDRHNRFVATTVVYIAVQPIKYPLSSDPTLQTATRAPLTKR